MNVSNPNKSPQIQNNQRMFQFPRGNPLVPNQIFPKIKKPIHKFPYPMPYHHPPNLEENPLFPNDNPLQANNLFNDINRPKPHFQHPHFFNKRGGPHNRGGHFLAKGNYNNPGFRGNNFRNLHEFGRMPPNSLQNQNFYRTNKYEKKLPNFQNNLMVNEEEEEQHEQIKPEENTEAKNIENSNNILNDRQDIPNLQKNSLIPQESSQIKEEPNNNFLKSKLFSGNPSSFIHGHDKMSPLNTFFSHSSQNSQPTPLQTELFPNKPFSNFPNPGPPMNPFRTRPLPFQGGFQNNQAAHFQKNSQHDRIHGNFMPPQNNFFNQNLELSRNLGMNKMVFPQKGKMDNAQFQPPSLRFQDPNFKGPGKYMNPEISEPKFPTNNEDQIPFMPNLQIKSQNFIKEENETSNSINKTTPSTMLNKTIEAKIEHMINENKDIDHDQENKDGSEKKKILSKLSEITGENKEELLQKLKNMIKNSKNENKDALQKMVSFLSSNASSSEKKEEKDPIQDKKQQLASKMQNMGICLGNPKEKLKENDKDLKASQEIAVAAEENKSLTNRLLQSKDPRLREKTKENN